MEFVEERWAQLYQALTVRILDPPVTLEATVVHGFKRGSKELGVPTANLDMTQLGEIGDQMDTGIYFGWACLYGVVYGCVVSVGWNPFYKNEIKTIEAHLLHNLDDFYDASIKLIICGYLRDEANFSCLEDLISCINSDLRISKQKLEEDSIKVYSDLARWPA